MTETTGKSEPTATRENEPSLEELAASYAAPAPNAPKDIVSGRYRILYNRPLPEFSNRFAQAYEAEDIEKREENLYALVCTNALPYRMQGIEALKNTNHPAMCRCHAAGPTPLSTPDETRMVMVIERPTGQKLSEIIAQTGPMNERMIMQRVIRPLNEALMTLSKYNINHGCINPDTLYLSGETLKIKESVSEPSGYSQPFWYEPPERLVAQPAGKGSGNAAADTYAIAVLYLYLYFGHLPVDKLGQKQFEERILQMGSFHAFTQNIDTTETMNDLLRGTLTDSPQDRWNHENIATWLEGKRFNLILPSVPRDSVRAFAFNGTDFFNYRSLAHQLYTHWDTAKLQLSASKLVKWMETNANRVTAADAMETALRAHLDNDMGDPKPLTDEALCKAIAILDPLGPMRYRDVSVTMDGFGKALAEAINDKNNVARQQLLTLIEIGHPGFLANLGERNTNTLAHKALAMMQTIRPMLKLKSLGFGLERIIYTLNHSLTCQSPLVLRYHPAGLTDVLQILDQIAPTAMKKTSLIDAQLASYIASKLDITKEIRVLELAAHHDLMTDSRLVMLKLLTLAQQKSGKPGSVSHKGLALWTASMVLPITEKIHQKSTREILVKELKRAAASGVLERITSLLFQDSLFSNDRMEYEKARALYQYHQDSIVQFRDPKRRSFSATYHGRYFSVAIGYLVLLASLYFSFAEYVRL